MVNVMINIKCLIKVIIINIHDTIKRKVDLNRTQLGNTSSIPEFLKILVTVLPKTMRK